MIIKQICSLVRFHILHFGKCLFTQVCCTKKEQKTTRKLYQIRKLSGCRHLLKSIRFLSVCHLPGDQYFPFEIELDEFQHCYQIDYERAWLQLLWHQCQQITPEIVFFFFHIWNYSICKWRTKFNFTFCMKLFTTWKMNKILNFPWSWSSVSFAPNALIWTK